MVGESCWKICLNVLKLGFSKRGTNPGSGVWNQAMGTHKCFILAVWLVEKSTYRHICIFLMAKLGPSDFSFCLFLVD